MPAFNVDYNLIDGFKHLFNDKQLVNELKVEGNVILKEPLRYANQELVKQLVRSSDSDPNKVQTKHQLIDGQTDLIVNQYEGGFKLWEGMHDLIDYFGCHSDVLDQLADSPVTILELGCGSGLASIYLSTKLQSNLYLQDFNEDVIQYFTAVNVFLNSQSSNSLDLTSRFNYLFGDWFDVNQDIEAINLKFDLIISSETLYNCDNYEKLVKLMESSLSPNGTVYIASKSHYFGVGGGSYSFIDYVESQSRLECDICHEIDAPLIRHILKLKHKK